MHVVFPGSFDPVTHGHLNIISRSSKIFSQIDVVIANNRYKGNIFSSQERKEFLEQLLCDYKNVEIFVWDKLMVEFLMMRKCNVIIRGVRLSSDYEYEFSLSQINKGLGHNLHMDVETILLPTDEKYFALSSSAVKDIVSLGGDVSDKVPSIIHTALKKRLQSE